MQASQTQLQALCEIQEIDQRLTTLNKQLDELPQKRAIIDVRHRKSELSAKRRTVIGMRKDAETQMAHAADEDASLEKKSRTAQALIDAAGTDYRSLNAHSKELSGYSGRRAALSSEIDGLAAKISEMEKLEGEMDSIEKALASKEESLIAEYRTQGAALLAQINQFKPRREALAATLDSKLLSAYERIAKAKGGVAICRLCESSCSVCRTSFEHSRVLALRSNAPLASCPSCGRIMLVDKKYNG